MILPPRLSPGDTVAAITLSWGGPGSFPHRYQAGKRQLAETFGVNVVETRHALADANWIWRNPQARADDLHEALLDPSIKAIISTIGGDDSIRILPFLDLELIRTHPKIFMGYSDTTISHFAFFKAGVTSFYGPSLMAGFGENGGLFPYMVDAVQSALFSSAPLAEIKPNREGWTVERLDWATPALQQQKRQLQPCTGWHWLQGTGVHRGRLIGGCFEVLDWLRGTDYWPTLAQWQDAILFLETSEEAPSPDWVKYTLRTLLATGVLARCKGILYGRPGGEIAPERFGEYDQMLRRVVAEEAGLPNLPIISNMDFGHTDPMMVLPYGVLAEIDCEARQLRILESAVKAIR